MRASVAKFQTAFLLFCGLVGGGVVFFYLFSGGKKEGPKGEGARVEGVAAAPVTSVVTDGGIDEGKPVVTRGGSGAEEVLGKLSEALRGGDFSKAAALVEQKDGGKEKSDFLRQLLTATGLEVPRTGALFKEYGAFNGGARHELMLVAGKFGGELPGGAVTLDLAKDVQTGEWRGREWRFSVGLVEQAVAKLRAKGLNVSKEGLVSVPDALGVGRDFLTKTLGRDFRGARGLTDHKRVPHEKLAGLCIVFEDGKFSLGEKRPLLLTANGEEKAWAIAKVRSDKQETEGEIGLELTKGASGAWVVDGLDFNSMLAGYVKASNPGGVYYSPIVKSPSGGDSIVVYFEFDEAGLHPRALAQLEIIASLLKSDPARKMRIAGHADARGSDAYNDGLSRERAANVRKRLAELGVPAGQIVTVGFGAKAPLDANSRADGSDNPDGRSRNRRTEIHLDF